MVESTLHPRFRDSPVLTVMNMGGEDDPTTQGLEILQEPIINELLDAAYHRALRLVHQRRNAIEQVGLFMHITTPPMIGRWHSSCSLTRRPKP